MEAASLFHTRTHSIGSSLPINKIVQQLPKLCGSHCCHLRMPSSAFGAGLQSHVLRIKQRCGGVLVAAGCGASDSGLLGDLERELEAEEEEEEEEWMREGRVRGRCKERKGMVELLECLETEAIMGEDQGREASDYNRRAQIFDKSARVFRALKARSQPTQSQQS